MKQGLARQVLAALLGMVLAGAMMLVLRGFTVDDALIATRYGFHIVSGHGARFNVGGPMTDGVTPLIWPWLLAPLCKGGALSGLAGAKWLGAVSWLVAAGFLAREVDQVAGQRLGRAHLSLLVVFGTPAIAAWAVSGMETGPAMALATGAVLSMRRPVASSLLAGAATLLRPELVVWAFVLALGNAMPRRRFALHAALATAPFVLVSAARALMFGAVAPLSLRAKPSDLHHGIIYVFASILIVGPILAVLAPMAWRRLPAALRWSLAAFAAHLLVVVAVGGDWMPMSRLLVPLLPSLGLVFAHLATLASVPSIAARLALCVCGQAFVLWRVGTDASRVGQDRAHLIASLRPRLQPTDVVATLDVGWVGASFDGTVVDLAGLTDPVIASLPGGHTSKAISPMLLAEKNPNRVVLLMAGEDHARAVENRIAGMDWVKDRFKPCCVLQAGRLTYRVLVIPGSPGATSEP